MSKILILLVIGGLIGWIASLIMKTDKQMGPLANIGVGVTGAFGAGLVMERGAISGDLGLVSLVTALIGAVALLGVVNLVRKGRIR
jgi:uncharacterized membrane protein YeaQ/YmgE (transglycosylase-associated protein family)